MVFSSLLFLFRFLPAVLILYYVAPRPARNLILFVVSLVFYAWGEPVYVGLILLSTVVDYTAGRLVAHYRQIGNSRGAKGAVLGSAVVNLALLGFFKYADFLIGIWNSWGIVHVDPLKLALPIGISFYTFQTMSYTIDVYRGDAPVQKNFVAFGAYVALFPQLIAGPIIRYKTVAEQLEGRQESVELFGRGVWRFMIGLGKKVLLANQIGALWTQTAALTGKDLSTAGAWLGVAAFTLQIYFDFSGYSDMAIGLGQMFGFSFPENFDYPYIARSITQFWRRWHISLGTWFKEYVYVPLGGNRRGGLRQIRNIAVVWILTGLWHGAYWNFVLWGVYYGVLLVLEKFVLNRILERLPAVVSSLYTMAVVMIGWAIFSWQDMANAPQFMKTMFGLGTGPGLNDAFYYGIRCYGFLLIAGIIGCTPLVKRLGEWLFPDGTIRRTVGQLVFVAAVFVLSVAMLVNSTYNPFLYFRF